MLLMHWSNKKLTLKVQRRHLATNSRHTLVMYTRDVTLIYRFAASKIIVNKVVRYYKQHLYFCLSIPFSLCLSICLSVPVGPSMRINAAIMSKWRALSADDVSACFQL